MVLQSYEGPIHVFKLVQKWGHMDLQPVVL